MNEFEQLFNNKNGEFDRLNPQNRTWLSIKEAMEEERGTNNKKGRFTFLKMAATFVLLIGLSAVWFLNSNTTLSSFDNISMVSPEGKHIALDPSLNKYTLVQFWESGNILCTTDNCYYYLPAYEKYKNKGFEIYAISLDKDKSAWLTGIEENKLPWIHVSDLKGWDSPVCVECNISKVPTSFLLNQKGEIVARDLDAEKLDNTLATLLAEK